MNRYEHHMLAEIYEQPQALRRTLSMYLQGEQPSAEVRAMLKDWPGGQGEILIAASGSSRHCGLAAKVLFEEISGFTVDVEYASEFSGIRAGRLPGVLVISQSGETSDTLAALRAATSLGLQTLAVTNVATSTMAREATNSVSLAAGVERAIPATKSFTCQLAAIYILALAAALERKTMDAHMLARRIAALRAHAGAMEAQMDSWREQMQELARRYKSASTFLYLGRGIHYAIAREGALKLKEASYVHAEGYPAGELRHGPNALVCNQVPVVILATYDPAMMASVERYGRTLQLLGDLKRQKAEVIAVANAGDEKVRGLATVCVEVWPAEEYLLPITEVVPLQLFSYFMALERGVDVDCPRNLTKAVLEAAAAI